MSYLYTTGSRIPSRQKMRITCQNCRAQYDIDSSELPPGGCEVECLGCGKVWHQWPENERSFRQLGSADADENAIAGYATRPFDLDRQVDAPDDSRSESDVELAGPTGGAFTRPEVKKILEEELFESTEIDKFAAGRKESHHVWRSPDISQESTWSKESHSSHLSATNENPTIRRAGSHNSEAASVRRRNGDGSRSDLFRYGILPLLLLSVFLGLVHFSLPIAGELFDEVKPYAEAYESGFGKAAGFAAKIFVGQ